MFKAKSFLASLLACASLMSASLAGVSASSATTTIDASLSSAITRTVSEMAMKRITEQVSDTLHDRIASDNVDTMVRNLQSATEDFDEFRDLFRRVTIWIPDFESATTVFFADLQAKARNIKCFNIVFGRMEISYNMETNQRVAFNVKLEDLDIECSLDYEWAYSFFNGAGIATINLNDNRVDAKLVFLSEDYAFHPPTSSQIESCDADITVSDMSFTGTVTDAIINAFEGLLRQPVEDAMDSSACIEMGEMGTELVQDFLERAASLLEPYLQPLEPWQTNATLAELNMTVPEGIQLMDFQDEGDDQAWFYNALQEVDAALGVWLIDPNTPREGGKDLGINMFLRENLLDENRALEIAVADFPFDFDPVVFQGHDEFLETTIKLENVRVYGLDTFSQFAPFINQGKYTLQNELSWDMLSFELDVMIDMKPSTLGEDAVLTSTHEGDVQISENVKMVFGVDNVNATMSALLAIDQNAFGQLKLGPLMYSDNILPCFWSSIFKTEVTVLEAHIGNIHEPHMEGFISKGIDHVVSQSVKAAFLMYESSVIRAMPNIFQVSVKGLMNEMFFQSYDGECPPNKEMPGYIDFRDLMLHPEESLPLGGSGTGPYGSLAASTFLFLKTQLATLEDDGTLTANDMFIRPMTLQQSGVEGMLGLPGDLFTLSASDIDWAGFDVLVQGFKFSLSDIQLVNIDTMVPPLTFLEPTKSPYELDNEVHFGPVEGRPLNVSAMFSISFGEGSPYYMKNDILVSMTSSAFEALAKLIVRMETMSFLNFPIDDLTNIYCWMATVAAPTLDAQGFRVDPNEDRGMSLKEFSNEFQDLDVNVECKGCTSTSLNLLPQILGLLKETDVTTVMASRLKHLVDDVVISLPFQTFLDRMINDAAAQCPHKAQYTEDTESIGANYADLPVPHLSEISIDTVQFALATTLQVGFVVFTQLYAETPLNAQDELAEERAFTIPEGSDLVNFTEFHIHLPSFLDSALDGLLELLSGTQVDPKTGKEDLSVNVFMREMFGSDGVFQWDLEGISFGPEDLRIDLHSVRVEGLDTFTKFEIAVPVGPQTIANHIAMKRAVLKLDFDISSGNESRRIQIAFGADDLDMSLPLFAAIDKNVFHHLQVGSLLRLPSILPCFFSAVYGFSFPHMIVNIGRIHKPRVVGLMPETTESLNTLVDTLFERYETSMHETLPSVFNNAVRPLLNSLFAFMISDKGCHNPLLDSLTAARRLMEAAAPPFMDFRDLFLPENKARKMGGHGDSRYGDLIRSVWSLIEDEILEILPSGESRLNTDVIAPLTEDGNIYFPGDFLSERIHLPFGPTPTTIAFRIGDLRIENLDTFGDPFSLLDPVMGRPNIINNTATIGVGDPLRFGAKVTVNVENINERIINDFDISTSFHSTTLLLTVLMKISEYRFAAFPIGDIFNLDCWLATMPPPALDSYGVRQAGVDPSAAVEDLLLTMKRMALNITCLECSSPGIQDLADKWSTPEASRDMTNAANDMLAYFAEVLSSGLIQNAVDRMISEAEKRCPHSPAYQPGFTEMHYQGFESTTPPADTSYAILLMLSGAAFVVVVGLLVFVIRFIVRRRHKRWLKTLPNAQLRLLKERQEKEEAKEAELNAATRSMFTSPEVPCLLRWLMPVIILGNVGFFLSGHLSLGAEVKMTIAVAGQSVDIEEFYQFSLARSTVEIWQAGGKELAILILIFSGLWPYTKQFITLTLWFLPPSRCSISRRGSILLWLDTLAKWSIVDIFTLVMSVAAFRVSITSPNLGFLPDDLYSFDLLVQPMWGLYANLLAQLISQISSHFIIHYHRNIVYNATAEYKKEKGLVPASQAFASSTFALSERSNVPDDAHLACPYGERKDLLNSHAFSRPHRGESGKLVTRGFVNGLVGCGGFVFAVALVVGCMLPSSGLDFLGILGLVMEAGEDWAQAQSRLSLFDLLQLLMDQAKFVGELKGYLGMSLLCAVLVLSVLIVPLAQTAALMYQWFVPMAGRKRMRMAILVEVLQAWQYMEVYVISVVVATWQLGPISTFMINSYCGSFQETFNMLSYFGLLEAEDAQCFRVDASIRSGSYILLGAAALLALLNTCVMNAVKQYFRDRDELISKAEMKERAAQLLESANKPEQPTIEMVDDSVENDSGKAEGDAASDYWDGRKDAEAYIKPVPVLFTDKFRWVLRRATPAEEKKSSPETPMIPDRQLIAKTKTLPSDSSTTSDADDEVPTPRPSTESYIRSVHLDLGDEKAQSVSGPNSTITPIMSGSYTKGRRNRLPSDGETSV